MSSACRGQPVAHAYTNAVTELGGFVTKTYRGADVRRRQHREELAIRSLTGLLPVATIDAPRNVKGSFSGFLVWSSAGVAARQGRATKASS